MWLLENKDSVNKDNVCLQKHVLAALYRMLAYVAISSGGRLHF